MEGDTRAENVNKYSKCALGLTVPSSLPSDLAQQDRNTSSRLGLGVQLRTHRERPFYKPLFFKTIILWSPGLDDWGGEGETQLEDEKRQ